MTDRAYSIIANTCLVVGILATLAFDRSVQFRPFALVFAGLAGLTGISVYLWRRRAEPDQEKEMVTLTAVLEEDEGAVVRTAEWMRVDRNLQELYEALTSAAEQPYTHAYEVIAQLAKRTETQVVIHRSGYVTIRPWAPARRRQYSMIYWLEKQVPDEAWITEWTAEDDQTGDSLPVDTLRH